MNAARENMVERQLSRRGIGDARVLEVFRRVPREEFVPERWFFDAYADNPLSIAQGQTISQPYIVAVMAQALQLGGDERVLEIGTGSGYAAAVLSGLAREVFTVERHASLADEARRRLERLGYVNVQVLHADGTLGWAAHAPYDAIAVAATGPRVPRALLEQLAVGGRLVMPVGSSPSQQELLRVTKRAPGEYRSERLMGVRFVPLIGEQGWPEPGDDDGRSAAH